MHTAPSPRAYRAQTTNHPPADRPVRYGVAVHHPHIFGHLVPCPNTCMARRIVDDRRRGCAERDFGLPYGIGAHPAWDQPRADGTASRTPPNLWFDYIVAGVGSGSDARSGLRYRGVHARGGQSLACSVSHTIQRRCGQLHLRRLRCVHVSSWRIDGLGQRLVRSKG